MISEGKVIVDKKKSIISLYEQTLSNLNTGANTLKVFAVSDDVLRPFEYSTSFLVSDTLTALPSVEITTSLSESNQNDYSFLLIIIILILGAAIIFVIKAKTQREKKPLT